MIRVMRSAGVLVSMNGMRDYVSWHEAYDDPESGMSWRLARVQHHVGLALDGSSGPVRALSLCAGDGRDLIGVLSSRADAERVQTTLVESNPELVRRAEESARGLAVRVLQADAGDAEVYEGLIPADLVLMVGIFGNIGDGDLEWTIGAAPAFCRPGATLIWSRGCDEDIGDLGETVRGWFARSGFVELAYEMGDARDRPAMGVMRYEGGPVRLDASRRLFRFIR